MRKDADHIELKYFISKGKINEIRLKEDRFSSTYSTVSKYVHDMLEGETKELLKEEEVDIERTSFSEICQRVYEKFLLSLSEEEKKVQLNNLHQNESMQDATYQHLVVKYFKKTGYYIREMNKKINIIFEKRDMNTYWDREWEQLREIYGEKHTMLFQKGHEETMKQITLSNQEYLKILKLCAQYERLICSILYSKFAKGGKKQKDNPYLLKDILASKDIEKVIPPFLLWTIQSIVGSPRGMNIRNLIWHGFLDEEIPKYDNVLLLLYLATMEAIGSQPLITQFKWKPQTFKTPPMAKQYMGFKDFSLKQCRDIVSTSYFVPTHRQAFIINAYELYLKGSFKDSLILLLPQYEHLLRIVFLATHEELPENMIQAQSLALYSTLDVILRKHIDIESKDNQHIQIASNRIVTQLGHPLLEGINDLLLHHEGLKIRDKLAHLELKHVPKDLAKFAFGIVFKTCSTFSEEKYHLPILDNYESQFHVKTLILNDICKAYVAVGDFKNTFWKGNDALSMPYVPEMEQKLPVYTAEGYSLFQNENVDMDAYSRRQSMDLDSLEQFLYSTLSIKGSGVVLSDELTTYYKLLLGQSVKQVDDPFLATLLTFANSLQDPTKIASSFLNHYALKMETYADSESIEVRKQLFNNLGILRLIVTSLLESTLDLQKVIQDFQTRIVSRKARSNRRKTFILLRELVATMFYMSSFILFKCFHYFLWVIRLTQYETAYEESKVLEFLNDAHLHLETYNQAIGRICQKIKKSKYGDGFFKSFFNMYRVHTSNSELPKFCHI